MTIHVQDSLDSSTRFSHFTSSNPPINRHLNLIRLLQTPYRLHHLFSLLNCCEVRIGVHMIETLCPYVIKQGQDHQLIINHSIF